jgi:acetyl esterase/lipase
MTPKAFDCSRPAYRAISPTFQTISWRMRAVKVLLKLYSDIRYWRQGGAEVPYVAYNERQDPPQAMQRSGRAKRIELHGIVTWELTPRRFYNSKKVIVIHAGDYTHGPKAIEYGAFLSWADQMGSTALVVIHRLAPQYRHPAALDDLLAVYRALLETTAPEDIIILGCGTALAPTLALRIRDEGLPRPHQLIMLCCWIDLSFENPDIAKQTNVPNERLPNIKAATFLYHGDADPKDPTLSPLYAELSGLPPTLQMYGTDELSYPDDKLFAEKLKQAGVDVTVVEAKGAFQTWVMAPSWVPETREAVAVMAAFVNCHKGNPVDDQRNDRLVSRRARVESPGRV